MKSGTSKFKNLTLGGHRGGETQQDDDENTDRDGSNFTKGHRIPDNEDGEDSDNEESTGYVRLATVAR